VCWLVVGANADTTKKHIRIAIFPCVNEVRAVKKFCCLVRYLEKETGLDINIVVPRDSMEFERDVKNKEIDFAFQNAQTYMQFADLYNNTALLRAVTRKGTTTQSGLVIVKKGSGINRVSDLKGRLVLFGPTHSTTRWVAAKLLFEESGLNIDTDLKAYSHGQTCEGMAFSVQFGGVDAAVICDDFLEEHVEKRQQLGVDSKQLVVIGRTKSVPTRVFSARRDIGGDIVTKVNQALLRLDRKIPADDKILYSAEVGGFQKVKRKDYSRTTTTLMQ
jgi:phosphonate transport system substrate-binding protein